VEVFNINDNYFKYQKCLSGITYQFVNQLDNIYNKNLMVGTNYCIYCMYNEFDIINNFIVNFYQVDVCSTENLDLTKRYFQIDNANLRTGHRVLLVGQIDTTENDVYLVDSRGYLILSDELAETGKTWRYKAYVKLGDNKGKQFHLKNSGNRFPLKGERKEFLDGHGYIIKSFFNYDLLNVGTIVPKLIFTDYEIARLSLNKNYELYTGFTLTNLVSGDTINIKYHDNDYIINILDDSETYKYIYTGTTGNGVNNIVNVSGETWILTDTNVTSNASVEDYILLSATGSTLLNLNSYVKDVDGNYIIITDYIPDSILNDYFQDILSTTYYFNNLMYTIPSTSSQTMLDSFYSKYFNISSGYLTPKEYYLNKYFDYDGFSFVFSGSTTTTKSFTTQNHYIKYKLYSHLNLINSIFTTGYTFLTNFSLASSAFDITYYDSRPNPSVYPSTDGDTKGTLMKITPRTSSFTNYFRKNTFVDIVYNYVKYKSLIVDLVDNEYFVIETYKSNSGLTIDSIDTIYDLKSISDILYYVYKNDSSVYYRVRDDAIRRNICNAYADFIGEDINIIDSVTALLTQDAQHKFVLKLYDPENYSNGGVSRLPTVVTNPLVVTGSTYAILAGEVMEEGGSNINGRGVAYDLSPYPDYYTLSVSATTVGTGVGTFLVNVVGLYPFSNYYYRAYAINSQGLSYGDVYSFMTGPPVYTGATVTTDSVTPDTHQMTVYGTVLDTGWNPIQLRGFAYMTGTTSTPDTGTTDYITISPENGLAGGFSSIITGLTYETVYSYRAFAMNVCGTTYGATLNTTTLENQPPVVETYGYDSLTYNSVNVYGNLISDDEESVTEMGICYSNTYPPTTADTCQTHVPIDFGLFNETLTGLTSYYTYYVRAYCVNSFFTSYGNTLTITTPSIPVAPIVLINGLSLLSHTGVTASLSISSNGGDTIDLKGLYYSTGSTVTIYDTYVSGGTGDAAWTSSITGLTSGLTYSLMGAAANSFGTGYTSTSGFTTLYTPTVSLNLVYTESTGATLLGDVIYDGGSQVTTKGIAISTSPSPTIPGWYGGIGDSSWQTSVTGLTSSTYYYVRSYATNEFGTTYSTGTTTEFTTTSANQIPVFDLTSPTFSNITGTTADAYSTIVWDGGAVVTSRGVCYEISSGVSIGSTTWYDVSGGTGSWTTSLTGLTENSIYYMKSFAINSEGVGYSNENSFNNYAPNDAIITQTLTSESSYVSEDSTAYEIGGIYEIITSISITNNSVPIKTLWSGATTSGETLISQPFSVMSWGSGVTSYHNSESPTYYLPVSGDSSFIRYFVSLESCGVPSAIISGSTRINAVYPYLTCNRTPSTPSIPTTPTLTTWCSSGDFYVGNISPYYTTEPMEKIIQVSATTISRIYTFATGSDNLIYFASPSSYGHVTSILIDGTPTTYTTYASINVQSSGNYPEFSHWNISYNIYAFLVGGIESEIETSKTIEYNF